MSFMGDDLLSTPAMYQDIGSMSMTPMAMPLGLGGMYGGMNTSYLGGMKMQPQLNDDKFTIIKNKEAEDKNSMKKMALVLGGMFAVIFGGRAIKSIAKNIRNAGGFNKFMKNKFQNVKDFFSGKTPPKPLTRWQRFKKWCRGLKK